MRHLNKPRGTRSIYAGQGSIDFTAAARSVLLAGCGADDDAERAPVQIKSNLATLTRPHRNLLGPRPLPGGALTGLATGPPDHDRPAPPP